MDKGYLKQVQILRVQCNATMQALPEFETAGRELEGDALRARVQEIGQKYGLTTFA